MWFPASTTSSKIYNLRKEQKEDTPPPQPRKSSPVEPPKMPELPTSIKLAWMIPAAIIVAWVCAVVTILGAFTDTNFARIGTAVGTCAAIWAAIHVSILNSDMHSWFSTSIQSSQQEVKDNPFASVAQNFWAAYRKCISIEGRLGIVCAHLVFGTICGLGLLAYS
jgi:hypothetical protein